MIARSSTTATTAAAAATTTTTTTTTLHQIINMPSKKQRAKMQRAKAEEVASQRPDHEARQVQLTGPTPQTVEQAYRAKTRAVLRMCKHGHPDPHGNCDNPAYAEAILLGAGGRQMEHRVATSKRFMYRNTQVRLQQKLAVRAQSRTTD